MAFQTVFKRYELKYLITADEKEEILDAMLHRMRLDDYGKTTIRNIYFDTSDHRLIRHSIEKPVYKEKLRLRSYSQVREEDTVFVELKKKYESVVYKRRIPLREKDAVSWLAGEKGCPVDKQISHEIEYFMKFYEGLQPKVFLSYDRAAYYEINGGDFRVTFDDCILARQNDLSLTKNVYGTPLLKNGAVLMELKCSGGIPLWMTKTLSRLRIYKTSFSKYGKAYEKIILPALITNNYTGIKENISYGHIV